MPVGAITPYGTSGVGATYFTPIKKLYQPPKVLQSSETKAYEVTLTTAAKVKAMELQGYPVSMISARLGLDLKTVYQYLGITEATKDTTFKTTYTPPKATYTAPEPINNSTTPTLPADTTYKSTYVAPKALYTEPQLLTQGRAELTADLTKLPTVPYAASQLISSVKETLVNALSQSVTLDNGPATKLFQFP